MCDAPDTSGSGRVPRSGGSTSRVKLGGGAEFYPSCTPNRPHTRRMVTGSVARPCRALLIELLGINTLLLWVKRCVERAVKLTAV